MLSAIHRLMVVLCCGCRCGRWVLAHGWGKLRVCFVIWLGMGACLSAVADEKKEPEGVTKDEMWRMLQRGSVDEYRLERVGPHDPRQDDKGIGWKGPEGPFRQPALEMENPLLHKMEKNIWAGLRDALLKKRESSKKIWRAGNLIYETGAGWEDFEAVGIPGFENIRMGGGAMKAHVNFLTGVSVWFLYAPLPAGEVRSGEEVLRDGESLLGQLMEDVRKAEPQGRAKEWNMVVCEGIKRIPPQKKPQHMLVGRWVHRGGSFFVVAGGTGKEAVVAEFQRLTASLAWLKEGRDMSRPPVERLEVPGAGFFVPCEGALLLPHQPELPGTASVQRRNCTMAVSAYDLQGVDCSLREAATAQLSLMNVGEERKYRLEDGRWGGMPSLVARPKDGMFVVNGLKFDWRMEFVLHEGRLCSVLLIWLEGSNDMHRILEERVARTVFAKPAGKIARPGSAGKRNIASLFYNELGLAMYKRGAYNGAAAVFQEAVDLNRRDGNILTNLASALTEQGRPRQALEVVEKHARWHAENKEVAQWHASLLARCGRDEESSALHEKMFRKGWRDENAMAEWVEVLQKLGRHEKAIETARAIYQEGRKVRWQKILADALWAAGKLDEARDQYRELDAELGETLDFASSHASLLLDRRDYKEVLDLVGKWEKRGGIPQCMGFTKGMAQMGLGWHKEAAATFTRLDEKTPGNQTIREALAQAQAMMGQGSREGVREDIEPVGMPREITAHAGAALAGCRIADDYKGEGWVALQDVTVWHWKEGADARTTRYRGLKVLDKSGVATFSTLYFPFKPASERISIQRMVVTDAEGRETGSFRKEEMYVKDADTGVADGTKLLCLPVPTLKEGSVIEVIHTKVKLGTKERFPLVNDGIAEGAGMVYGAIVFTGQVDKLRFARTPRMAQAAGDGWTGFEASRVKRRRGSSDLPPWDQWGMVCWAGDKRATWEAEAKEYMDEIRDCLEDDLFAASVVDELGLAGKPRGEIVSTVVGWLNRKFQYQGLEFGRRARMPARGALTVGRGFGDCKDLSVMVRTVLRKAGIRAELALVNSDGYVNREVPDLDQFDHMVVFLPDFGPGILDPTLRHFNTPEALPDSLTGGQAFLVEGTPPQFVDMKEATAAERSIRIEKEVSILAKSGDVRCRERVVVSPSRAAGLRYALSSIPAADHQRWLEGVLRRRENRLEMKSFKADGIGEIYKPLLLELEYQVAGGFRFDEDTWQGALPVVMERALFEAERERDRDLPMRIRTPDSCSVFAVITAPDGYRWLGPGKPDRQVDEPGMFEGRAGWKIAPHGVQMAGTLKVLPADGDAGRHIRLQNANEATFRHWTENIRFGKK